MCECGCTSGCDSYLLRGPGLTVYAITFQRACANCSGPSAVIVRHFPSRKAMDNLMCGPTTPLPFFDSRCGWKESVIVTGRTKDEWINELRNHLIGIDPLALCDEESRTWDEAAADEVLDEMYGDSCFTPRLPDGAKGGGK